MAEKIKLTRPELKRFRDILTRYSRFLPMLKLKQQQLQLVLRGVAKALRQTSSKADAAAETFARYDAILADIAGIDVRTLAEPIEVRTTTTNIAGVNIPVFEEAVFAKPSYSLFGTPAWVDRALLDLRELNRQKAELAVLQKQYDLLNEELTRIVQRVNLFEKIKIPEAKDAIRVIRIKLGDEMTAAVGRAKIAKMKLIEQEEADPGNLTDIEADQEDDGE